MIAPMTWGAGLLALGALLGGCAGYAYQAQTVETRLAAGQYAQALDLIAAQQGREGTGVLYGLNRGMVQHLMQDYDASNRSLEDAKREMDALYGVSLSEQAGAIAVNESLIRYKGDPHEQRLLHAYKILNYLALGDLDGARVEVLQADLRMRSVGGDGYGENGFVRYLCGIVYEGLGELDSAYIDYRKAYEYYRANAVGLSVPESLERDLLRLAERQGRREDLEEYARAFGDLPGRGALDGAAPEVIVLLQGELVPLKREQGASVFDPRRGHFVSIALPYYPDFHPAIAGVRVWVDGQMLYADRVEDVAAQARAALAERMPAITARAVARVALKTQASRQAQEQNETLGALLNLAATLTERADTRSWSSLPASIWMARVPLAAGQGPLRIEVLGAGGEVLGSMERSVAAEARRLTVESLRWIPLHARASR